MKNFVIEPVKNKKSSIVRKTIRFNATNNNKMTLNDVKKFYDYLLTQRNMSIYDISVLVKSDEGHKTLKTFDDTQLRLWNDENYYEDKPNKKQLIKALNEYYYVDFIFKK